MTALPVDARPAALLNGRPVHWGDMRAMLNEAAGSEVLEEVILDYQIRRMLGEEVLISESAILEERRALAESLNPDPDLALRLLEELRSRRGLGPVRFDGMLRRSAGLRQLVADRVSISENDVKRMYDLHYGPRRQARLITVGTIAEAQALVDELGRGASFADLATMRSNDMSASRGGLLEPIAREDPVYPEAVRRALWSLGPGQVSAPILVDGQYAMLELVAEVSGQQTSYDEVADRLRQEVRRRQERILMDELAEGLLDDASITIFDESLNDSWRRRSRQ